MYVGHALSSGETCNVLTCKRLWLLSHEVSRMIHSNQRHLATLFITVAQQISATPHSSQLKYTLQIDPIQITPTHGRLYLGFALEDVAQSYAVYDWKKSSTGIVSKVLPNYMDPGSNKFLEKDCYNCMWQPLFILHFFIALWCYTCTIKAGTLTQTAYTSCKSYNTTRCCTRRHVHESHKESRIRFYKQWNQNAGRTFHFGQSKPLCVLQEGTPNWFIWAILLTNIR